MAFEDKTLKCVDCGADFTYTADEQTLHQSLGYKNEPKRCQPCREAKKRQNPQGRFGQGRSGQGRFGQDRGPREMFTAICAECGKEAQIPFKPRGDKPVYCNDCFRKMKSNM